MAFLSDMRVPNIRVINVPRNFVEGMDIEWTLDTLRFAAEHQTPSWVFSIDGYNKDGELWEIHSVRAFIAEIDKKFNLWLGILNPEIGAYAMIVKCLIGGNSTKKAIDIMCRHLLAMTIVYPSSNTIERAVKCIRIACPDACIDDFRIDDMVSDLALWHERYGNIPHEQLIEEVAKLEG